MEMNSIGLASIFGENFLNLNENSQVKTVDDVFQNYLNTEINSQKEVPQAEGVWSIVESMNQEQTTANNLMMDVIMGKSEDTHGALIAQEKATTKMEIMVKVRDELIQTYEKLINIQI